MSNEQILKLLDEVAAYFRIHGCDDKVLQEEILKTLKEQK